MAISGQTYELEAILRAWEKQLSRSMKLRDPLTNQVPMCSALAMCDCCSACHDVCGQELAYPNLAHNYAVRSLVQRTLEANEGWLPPGWESRDLPAIHSHDLHQLKQQFCVDKPVAAFNAPQSAHRIQLYILSLSG